jgi:hypothetical protein
MALLLGFAALVAARLPGVWPDGRLWAEEGVVYLAHAWAEPWWMAALTVHTGYLNLPASIAPTLAVHLVPLEHVPQVTMLFALAVQLVPAVILATSGIAWLRDWRVLGVALLWLGLVPTTEEVWLNSITSQFHVTLAVALLLGAPIHRGRMGWLHDGVLLIAPLCGPVAGTLFPLFALRAWIDRSRHRWVQAALLLPGLLVQLSVMLMHPEPARMVALPDLPIMLAAVTGKQILLPMLGASAAGWLMRGVAVVFASGHWEMLAMLAPLGWFGAGALAVWRGADATVRWLFLAGLAVMAISYAGALTPGGAKDMMIVAFGQRYYFVSAVLFGLVGVGVARTGRQPERVLAQLLMAWMLAVGVAQFRPPQIPMASGPAWRPEVAAWRADPKHPLAIWPQGWSMALQPKRH